ncbi:iron ABC transporter permease [Chitinophaga sp. XS-30]|uniref:FecCD family ABC transporter permease n=1 Tax=Chitinophaga sp. XS-30 TaxID=2604421 RepID=UPI0011DE0322|nr:iron ABC transporter permease [Chitinophaga sp. XS-30]QEH42405.1 iron ABC transporter permease [Chitinophaga sp. XS-30]
MEKRTGLIVLMSISLLLVIVMATGTGALSIKPLQVVAILLEKLGLRIPVAYDDNMPAILWMIRLPRVILAVLIGAGLAVAGAALQGLFRNPLADPTLIGVSAGASFTAVLMILLQASVPLLRNMYLMNLATFAGAFVTALIVFRISRTAGQAVMTTMLLAGVAINALCNAMTGFLTYNANEEQLRSITFWTLGSLGGASWQTVSGVLPFILIPVLLLPRTAQALNVFALGEREAMHSGVKTAALKTQLIIYATMAVAAGVAVAGIIGFVGLVVPHIIRQIAGPDHRIVVPCSALTGAILLTLADLISRTVAAPAEVPVGIVTALVGTPVFIWLIIKQKKLSLA